jgi:2-dehydropantoate 2-reductase
MQKLVFGEYDGSSQRAGDAPARCLRQGGHRPRTSAPNIRQAVWQKFVFLVGLSGTTATTRTPVGVIRRQRTRSRSIPARH